jgi:magnesium chelatase subunit I
MKIENIKYIRLKASGYQSKSIKKELRTNLRWENKIRKTFDGVHGFENTVIQS